MAGGCWQSSTEINSDQRDRLSAVDTQLPIHTESRGKSLGVHEKEHVRLGVAVCQARAGLATQTMARCLSVTAGRTGSEP